MSQIHFGDRSSAMVLKKIGKKLGMIGASLVLMTAQMTPFFVFGGSASANGGDPRTECSLLGLLYLDKIDEINDDNDNDDDADGNYVSDEGYNYYVDVDDNPNPIPSDYTLNPEPKLSGYYDSVSNIDLDSIVHFGKFGNGGGLSHITICYSEVIPEPETGRIEVKKEVDNGDGFVNDSPSSYGFKWGIEAVDSDLLREFGTTSEELSKATGHIQ
jgi:hypothetical protein